MQGIYIIKNKVNKKAYIGSSITIEDRLERHKKELKYKRHKNIHLQRAWNKYGEENFELAILQIIENEKDLFSEEYKYQKIFNCLENGYNQDYPYGEKIPRSEKVREKISKGLTGKIQTEEQKRKNSEWHKNYIWTEEHKKKRRDHLIRKNKINPPMLGKCHTPEAKKKMSEMKRESWQKRRLRTEKDYRSVAQWHSTGLQNRHLGVQVPPLLKAATRQEG